MTTELFGREQEPVGKFSKWTVVRTLSERRSASENCIIDNTHCIVFSSKTNNPPKLKDFYHASELVFKLKEDQFIIAY